MKTNNKKSIFTLSLAAAVFSAFVFSQIAFAGGSAATIGANVIVPSQCPFAVDLGVQSAYSEALGTVSANYFLFTLSSCTLSGMNGFVNITTQNNQVINSLPVNSGTLTNTPTSFTFNIPLSSLSNTLYDANVGFTGSVAANFSVAQFQVLSPQNVIITSFSGSSQVNVNSQQSFLFTLLDDGQLSTGPITANIVVVGPVNSILATGISSLSPSQSANEILTTGLASNTVGSYTATITANYFITTNQGSENAYSDSQTFSYNVVTPSPAPPSPGPSPPTAVTPITVPSNLQLTVSPLFVSAAQNSSVLSSLGIRNTAGVTETVNLTVAPQFSPYILLSATSVSIKPGQTVNIGIVFSSLVNSTSSFRPPSFSSAELQQGNSPLPPGTYVIPVTIMITAGSTTSSQTEYFTFTVTPTQQGVPSLLNQINMMNGTTAASGQIKITNTYSFNLTNVTLDTLLPLAVAKNISDITAYGIPSRVFSNGQNYVIQWEINRLPPGQILYGYYNILNPQNQVLLRHVQSLFSAPTPPAPTSIFRLLDLSLPTFYTSTTGQIRASILYTGSNPQNITSVLYGPSSASVPNPVQTIYTIPNQVIAPTFNVTPGAQTGTDLFTLSISTAGANQTYSLPILVLAKQSSSSTVASTTTTPQSILGPSVSLPLLWLGFGVAVFIIVAIAILKLRAILNRPQYTEDRAARLLRMKNRIERSEKDDKIG